MTQAKATRRGKQQVNRGAGEASAADPVTPAVRRIVVIRDGQFVRSAGRGAGLKVATR